MMNSQPTPYEAYSRQMILPGFGQAAQAKLAAARVLVVGAGGLGCPVLQYLAAAGVGHLGIADGDSVSPSNLHRQVLYSMADVGQQKAAVAAAKLRAQYPSLTTTVYAPFRSTQYCAEQLALYDVVVDGTDRFGSKYLLNDACVLAAKPLVYGAVSRWEGQVGVFNAALPDGTRSAHYRHLFATPPAAGSVASCEEAGVIGMLPAIIGSMQAVEVLKLLTGLGEPLHNQLLTYDAWRQITYKVQLPAAQGPFTAMPQSWSEWLAWDYDDACGPLPNNALSVEAAMAMEWIAKGAQLIDVREYDEQPLLPTDAAVRIPMATAMAMPDWDAHQTWLFVCQRGQRSLQVAAHVQRLHPQLRVYSVAGGAPALWQAMYGRPWQASDE